VSRVYHRAWAGIDWGHEAHYVWVLDEEGTRLDEFAVAHSAAGLDELVTRLEALGPIAGIAIETDRYLLVAKLLEAGFPVYPINPKVAHRWAECFDVDPATSDPRAAEVLARGLRAFADQCRRLVPDDPHTAELAELCAAETDLIGMRTALANKLKACVRAYHPDLLDWFGDLTQTTACDFLVAYPTAQALRDATPQSLHAFLKAHRIGLGPRWQKRIDARSDAPRWPDEPGRSRARAVKAEALAKTLRSLNAQLAKVRKAIAELFAAHPDAELVASLPGVGAKLAPRLLAHLGSDRERWDDAEALQVLSGTVPVTRTSGKLKGHRLFRWACQKRFRNTMRQWAFTSLSYSVWARAYYERARARKQSHELALRNLGAKWLKILFRLWHERTPYDERRHLRALEQHGSPLTRHIRRSQKCGELMKKLLT